MTVRDLGEALIWFGAIAGALLTIGLFLRAVIVRPLRTSLTEEIGPMAGNLEKIELRVAALDRRMSDHIDTHRK